MAGGLQLIPDVLPWSTLEDIEEYENEVEQKDTPNTDLNCNEHWQVSFPGGVENSGVLKKNWKLDKENDRSINKCSNIDPVEKFKKFL